MVAYVSQAPSPESNPNSPFVESLNRMTRGSIPLEPRDSRTRLRGQTSLYFKPQHSEAHHLASFEAALRLATESAPAVSAGPLLNQWCCRLSSRPRLAAQLRATKNYP